MKCFFLHRKSCEGQRVILGCYIVHVYDLVTNIQLNLVMKILGLKVRRHSTTVEIYSKCFDTP